MAEPSNRIFVIAANKSESEHESPLFQLSNLLRWGFSICCIADIGLYLIGWITLSSSHFWASLVVIERWRLNYESKIEVKRLNAKVREMEMSREKKETDSEASQQVTEKAILHEVMRLKAEVMRLNALVSECAPTLESWIPCKGGELEMSQEKKEKDSEASQQVTKKAIQQMKVSKLLIKALKEHVYTAKDRVEAAKKNEVSFVELMEAARQEVTKAEICLRNAQKQWEVITIDGDDGDDGDGLIDSTQPAPAQNQLPNASSSTFFKAAAGELKALEDRVKAAKEFESSLFNKLASARQEVENAESCFIAAQQKQKEWNFRVMDNNEQTG